MPSIKISEAQKEEIQKEIKCIKSSETGKLYLDKKFNGKDPTAAEYIKANGCGLWAFIQWLKPDKGKDGELKSLIQRLTRGAGPAVAALFEEISLFRLMQTGEAFRVTGMQAVREKEDKKYREKKRRELAAYEKKILEVAKFFDQAAVEAALIKAKRKIDETPKPAALIFASDYLKHGVLYHDPKMKESSKGAQPLRRFICIAYKIAKEKTDASDNSIYKNIAAIINILDPDGKTQTIPNIRNYVKRHCTK